MTLCLDVDTRDPASVIGDRAGNRPTSGRSRPDSGKEKEIADSLRVWVGTHGWRRIVGLYVLVIVIVSHHTCYFTGSFHALNGCDDRLFSQFDGSQLATPDTPGVDSDQLLIDQQTERTPVAKDDSGALPARTWRGKPGSQGFGSSGPVSYTHLTLPTTPYV